MKKALFIILTVATAGWWLWHRSDYRIIKLIQGEVTSDQVVGAYLAGEKGDKKFVPYLLNNMADPSVSTHIQFKGFSVYYEKAKALQRIYRIAPTKQVERFDIPDPAIIKFYEELYEKDNARKR